jgi:hypothetical protein
MPELNIRSLRFLLNNIKVCLRNHIDKFSKKFKIKNKNEKDILQNSTVYYSKFNDF